MHDPSWPAHALAAAAHADPYPYYAQLARTMPCAFDGRLDLWVAAHPAAVRAALAHADCLVRPPREPVPAPIAGGPAGDLFAALVRMNDGARHAGPKAVLQQALAQEGEGAAAATSIAHRLGSGDAAALNAFIHAVPVQAVASLLGCGAAQRPALAQAVAAYVAGLSPGALPGQAAAAHAAATRLLAAMAALAGNAPPGSLAARVAGAGWADRHALHANLVGLLVQAYEAGAGLLGNAIVARLRGAGEAPAALVARVAVDDPAIHNTRRWAARDITLAGATVRAGDAILLLLAAALPFGDGRHACPGMGLAQGIAAHALAVFDARPLPRVTWRYRPLPNARIPLFIDKDPP